MTEQANNNEANEAKKLSRRDALKVFAVASGATVLSTLPSKWETPFVDVGTLPAFAQTSPNQYTFDNIIEEISFEGPGADQLKVATTPGWIVIAEQDQVVGAESRTLDYPIGSLIPPWIVGYPWLRIKRKWDILFSPAGWLIKVKIKIKFRPLPGFTSSNVPDDDVECWFFGTSGVDLSQYYVSKVKVKKNKIELEFYLPVIGSGLFPFFISGYFPFFINLLGGGSLYPGYYIGPGLVGEDISSSYLSKWLQR
jgi:hypothetical protein